MFTIEPDNRSPERRALDEAIANEPLLPPPDVPPGTVMAPMETHLAKIRRPLAVAGVVENGLIRPIDPTIRFVEHTKVIIVTTTGG